MAFSGALFSRRHHEASMRAMIYKMRLPADQIDALGHWRAAPEDLHLSAEVTEAKARASISLVKPARRADAVDRSGAAPERGDRGLEPSQDVKQQRYCAAALVQLTSGLSTATEEVMGQLREDGVVKALLGLLRACREDPQTQASCAAALRDISELRGMRRHMLETGSAGPLVELTRHAAPRTRIVAAEALTRLTTEGGFEDSLVRSGLLSALHSTQRADLEALAAFNVSCVEFNFVGAPTVISAVLALLAAHTNANAPAEDVLHRRCLYALVNLLRFTANHQQLLDDAGVPLLARFAQEPSRPNLQAAAIVCYFLLSGAVAHVQLDEMVTQGMLSHLSGIPEPARLRRDLQLRALVAVARLVRAPEATARAVRDGAAAFAVSVIVDEESARDEHLLYLCTDVLLCLSVHERDADTLVRGSVVSPLVFVAFSEAASNQTARNASAALCALLCHATDYRTVLREGALRALRHLAATRAQDPLQGNIAFVVVLSVYNLSCMVVRAPTQPAKKPKAKAKRNRRGSCEIALEQLGMNLVPAPPPDSPTAAETQDDGELDTTALIDTLLSLADAARRDPEAAKFSIGAIWNLAAKPDVCQRLVRSGAIKLLVEFIRSDNEAAQADAVAALHTIAANNDQFVDDTAETAEGAELLAALVPLVRAALFTTRLRAAAMLLKLSADARCATVMCDVGALEALAALATSETDRECKVRCVAALANVALVPAGRLALARRAAVVEAIVRVGAVPDEGLRASCASTLHAVSSEPGTEVALVRGGAASAIKVMALVASDNVHTKLLCVKTLVNLFHAPEAHAPLVADDIVWTFGTLAAATRDEDTQLALARALASLSALALYDKLAHHNVARGVLALLDAGRLAVARPVCAALYNVSVGVLDRDDAQAAAALQALAAPPRVITHLSNFLGAPDAAHREAALCTLCALACSGARAQAAVMAQAFLPLAAAALETFGAESEPARRAVGRALVALARGEPERRRECAANGVALALCRELLGEDAEGDWAVLQCLHALSAQADVVPELVALGLLDVVAAAQLAPAELRAAVLYNASVVDGVEGDLVAGGMVVLLHSLFFSDCEEEDRCRELAALALVNVALGRVNTARVCREAGVVKMAEFLLGPVDEAASVRPGAAVDPVSGWEVPEADKRRRLLVASALQRLVKHRANRLPLIEAGMGGLAQRLAVDAAAWCDPRTLLCATGIVEALAAVPDGRTRLVADGLNATVISLSSVSASLPAPIRSSVSACLSSLASHATTGQASANRGFVRALLGLSENVENVARTTLVAAFELSGGVVEGVSRCADLVGAAFGGVIESRAELGARPVPFERHLYDHKPLDFAVEKPVAMTKPVPPKVTTSDVAFPPMLDMHTVRKESLVCGGPDLPSSPVVARSRKIAPRAAGGTTRRERGMTGIVGRGGGRGGMRRRGELAPLR